MGAGRQAAGERLHWGLLRGRAASCRLRRRQASGGFEACGLAGLVLTGSLEGWPLALLLVCGVAPLGGGVVAALAPAAAAVAAASLAVPPQLQACAQLCLAQAQPGARIIIVIRLRLLL